MNTDRHAVRAYRALLRLYPRRFRDDYGTDMVLLVQEQLRHDRAWRVIVRSAIDLAITVPNQHLEARVRRTHSSLVPLVYLVVSIAGLLLAVLGGTNPATLAIGLLVAAGAGTVSVVAWRQSNPVHESTITGRWWKFLLAGPSLLALVIVAAGVGIDAWHLGLITVFTALMSIAVGIGLGVAHLFKLCISRNPA